ncbi:MAG TPA: D-tyrosyl-tRNA(Tyr) deacylase [Eubacteriaceae bacterium]|jgi:D-tyrosyl-tRNA(Tyr) deacylase|nr:D-tyrosyl-tRNA(Tyr) deacylase [Eubacteriaceae bacterium]
MRAVVQRVKRCSVEVDGKIVGSIGKGLLVLLGIKNDDSKRDIEYIKDKILNLRIFEDDRSKMNLSLKDVSSQIMIVSQFTLYGDCRKGRRPSFIKAASPETAQGIYMDFVEEIKSTGIYVQQGVFQAHMDISIVNEGPVTIILDSEKRI